MVVVVGRYTDKPTHSLTQSYSFSLESFPIGSFSPPPLSLSVSSLPICFTLILFPYPFLCLFLAPIHPISPTLSLLIYLLPSYFNFLILSFFTALSISLSLFSPLPFSLFPSIPFSFIAKEGRKSYSLLPNLSFSSFSSLPFP